jgi:hypothetical protein
MSMWDPQVKPQPQPVSNQKKKQLLSFRYGATTR